jgi:Zn-finger nucleic acid-binding protein
VEALFWEESAMSNGSSLSRSELEERIAIVRENIRQLIEQAAAYSGAEDEDRNADRIAQQTEELNRLIKQRDALPE